MKNGNYNKKIDFSKFVARKCPLYIYNSNYEFYTCGTVALALLTGIDPDKIINPNKKDKEDWKDRDMVNFLRRKEFKVIQLTKCNVTNDIFLNNPITSNHVLLLSQLLIKREATWAVIYKDLLYHNFKMGKLSGYEFINNPILSAYVVWHKNFV